MSILIKKPGLLTTVQDLGRFGFRKFGVNPTGVMDSTAARLINVLLDNEENTPVLEMHFPAAEIYFEEAALIALGGAEFSATLDGEPLENWRIYRASGGTTMKFNDKISGTRVYLSIKGGFAIKNSLGSASTNLKAHIGGLDGRTLKSGDRLPFNRRETNTRRELNYKISNSLLPFYSAFPTVRVVAGAHFDDLNALAQQNFRKCNYRITTHSDRMGFRLLGEPLYRLSSAELLSSAVDFGTIQLLPDGQMIVLMADHQTTGGYPRIAHVVPTDLPLLAQLGAGAKIAFHLIEQEDAEKLFLQFEHDLQRMKIAARLRFL